MTNLRSRDFVMWGFNTPRDTESTMTTTFNDLNTLMAEIGQKLKEDTRPPPRKRMVEVGEVEVKSATFPTHQAKMIRERLKAHKIREEAFNELHRIDQAEDPEIREVLLAQFLARYPNREEIEKLADDARRMFAWTWHERERARWIAEQGGRLPWQLEKGQPPPPLPERPKRPVREAPKPVDPIDQARAEQMEREERERRSAEEKKRQLEKLKRQADQEQAGRAWAARQLAAQMRTVRKEAEELHFEELSDRFLESSAHRSDRIMMRGSGRRMNNAKPWQKRPWQLKKLRRND